jgi:hypothetical protein
VRFKILIFFLVDTDCFESHEQFFSYLATVTIAGDRAANLDLCLGLTAYMYTLPKSQLRYMASNRYTNV